MELKYKNPNKKNFFMGLWFFVVITTFISIFYMDVMIKKQRETTFLTSIKSKNKDILCSNRLFHPNEYKLMEVPGGYFILIENEKERTLYKPAVDCEIVKYK